MDGRSGEEVRRLIWLLLWPFKVVGWVVLILMMRTWL